MSTPLIDAKYMARYKITPNFATAEIYLSKLISPQPLQSHIFTFAVFSDKLTSKDEKKELTHQFIGTWHEHKDKLVECNQAGCGIFVTVNHTDGHGRKNHNIIRVNTVYIEDDIGDPLKLPIEPSMVVESSKGKFHYYFLTDTADKLTARAIQLHLTENYNCDKNAKDLSRVLRIPGFYHLKAKQYPVALRERNGHRYPWPEIVKAFPPAAITSRYTTKAVNETWNTIPDSLQIITALRFINPECTDDRNLWLNILMALHYEYRGVHDGLVIANEWSRGDYMEENEHIKFEDTKRTEVNTYGGEDDVTYIWNSLSYEEQATHPITLGTLMFKAKEGGFIHGSEAPPIVIDKIYDTGADILKKISQHYAIVITSGGSTRIARRNPSSGHYTYNTKQDFELAIGHIKIPNVNEKSGMIEWKQAAPIWLSSTLSPRFDNVNFIPEPKIYCDQDKRIIPTNKKILNTFFGFDIRPLSAPGNTSWIEDFVLTVICDNNQQQADHLHKWIAHTRQKPAEKTGLMVNLMGSKGCGKTFMANIIEDLNSPFNYKAATFNKFTGGFNSHFARKTLLFFEEITWGGKTADNSVLKDLITATNMVVSTKYMPDEPDSISCFDIVACSNPGFSVPEEIRSRERRFWTLSLSDIHRRENDYFAKFGFRGTIERTENLRAYAEFLDRQDLTDYVPQDIPNHVGEDSRYNQIETGGDPIKFILDMHENEEIIPTDESNLLTLDLITTSINRMWMNDDPKISTRVLMKVQVLKDQYNKFKFTSRSPNESSTHIAKKMDDFLPTPHKKRVHPNVKELKTFMHLKKDSYYLELPNYAAIDKHLKKLALID